MGPTVFLGVVVLHQWEKISRLRRGGGYDMTDDIWVFCFILLTPSAGQFLDQCASPCLQECHRGYFMLRKPIYVRCEMGAS